MQSLSLSDNKNIRAISDLQVLGQLNELYQLDVQDCPLAHMFEYEQKVFEKFPRLQILDNKDKDGNDVFFEEQDLMLTSESEDSNKKSEHEVFINPSTNK